MTQAEVQSNGDSVKTEEKKSKADSPPPSVPAPSSLKDLSVDAALAKKLATMKAAQRKAGIPDYATRVANLDKLERVLLDKKEDIAKAISKDFGNRSRQESLIAEVLVTAGAIKYARSHLAEWMETESRDVNWTFLPARAELRIQPLGVVGIISPWNYPVQLALSPLAGVIAAGNRAMLKPSELVPETSELLAKMIADNFDKDFLHVITGGVEEGVAFSKLAFDHLVFTGSTSVGKIVMRAAAENLVPCTLELGGKSPAIVGASYSLEKAAKKIMMGKLFNAGQTCIAPDYALIPKGRVDAFVEECKTAVKEMYPKLAANGDYTSVVNDRHYSRLAGYLRDAEDKGGKVVKIDPASEDLSPETRKMHPHLVVNPKSEMLCMQDEIFGPILPIVTYESLDEAIAYVNDHPRPLALYYFDTDDQHIERVLDETISGGVTINETMLHIAQDDLPFGGVGPSGMGHYHAKEGFDAFSKRRPVFYQSRINGMSLLSPPYGNLLERALKLLLR